MLGGCCGGVRELKFLFLCFVVLIRREVICRGNWIGRLFCL